LLRAYPGIFLLGMIIPGIVLAELIHLPEWIYILLSLLFCLLGFVCFTRSNKTLSVLFFGLCTLCFSAFNFSLKYYPTGSNHVTRFFDNKVSYHIYGEVADWPRVKTNSTEIKISLDSLSSDYIYPVRGMVLLKLSDTTTCLERGDRIEFYGKIYPVKGRESPGGFNYQRYLNLKGIHGIVYLSTLLDVRIDKRNRFEIITAADKIRGVILASLQKNLAPTTSALAAGFLIGETRNIPGNIYSWFRDSGTMHLLAVSGSNVILVIIFFTFLLKPFKISRNKRTLFLLLVLLMFTLISFGEPSVVRASLMASLVLVAGLIGRRYDLNNIIAMTAAIILLFDPTQLFDVGFQLSFVTAWGLILIVPLFHNRLEKFHNRFWYRYLFLPVLVSFVAQISSGPLIALYFQRLPVISVVANLVIVMLTSVAVIGTLSVLIADLILPILGLFVGSIVNKILELIIICLEFFGGQEIPVISTGIVPLLFVFLFYIFVIFAIWAFTSKPIRRVWLIALFITLNLSLIISIGNSCKDKKKTDIWITNLPGGTAVIVKKSGCMAADLIISGLRDRDYPIDDRIIKPLLENMNIEKLNSVLILSAEYGSLKDLVNLFNTFGVESIYIPGRLEKSLSDIIYQINLHEHVQRVKILPDKPIDVISDGFFPFDNGLIASFGDERVLFTLSLDSKCVDLIRQNSISTLVISNPTYRLSAISDIVNQTKLKNLIVARINNDPEKILQNQLISSQSTDFKLINLDLDGFYRLSIPDQ